MANISNKISSMRLLGLYNKKDENLDLLDVNKEILEERYQKRLQAFRNKEERKLRPLKLACADIEEEVNKCMPDAMRGYNTKDYWSRREAIHTWRKTRDEDETAFDKMEERLHELDALKYAKEKADFRSENRLFSAVPPYPPHQ